MAGHEPLESPPQVPKDLRPRIPGLKREFGDLFLYRIGETVFAYRPLTLGEFLAYQDLAGKDDLEAEELVLAALIYPEDARALLDETGAGAAAGLLDAILRSSTIETLDELQALLSEERARARTAQSSMIAWVCAAFPDYTEERCYGLTQRRLVHLTAMAEIILGRTLELEPVKKGPKERPGLKKGFGMMAPGAMEPGDRRASEVVGPRPHAPMMQPPPRPAPSVASPPAFFDFSEENQGMGFNQGDRVANGGW